jgi:hypothetical protein
MQAERFMISSRPQMHEHRSARLEKRKQETAALKFLLFVMAALTIGAAPALAEVEQCRFIQAKPEREACYERQAIALAAKRKPEPAPNAPALDSLQQMRREDDALYKSMRGICRGC